MSGTIGLTNAGVYLDSILTKYNPPYKTKLINFIHTFNNRLTRIRPVIKICDNMDDICLILNLLKNKYILEFDKDFKEIVDELTYRLVRKYIHALTRINFTPTTKTQLDLIHKEHYHCI
jgi:hypothetical protein